MSWGAEGPAGGDADELLRALDGPADEDLEFSGPGDGEGADERALPEASLPGGVDHTTAAVGGGSLGLVLLGIAGAFTRRRNRRRYESLDE
jgi:MYXO-CTERM domain-containing protein